MLQRQHTVAELPNEALRPSVPENNCLAWESSLPYAPNQAIVGCI